MTLLLRVTVCLLTASLLTVYPALTAVSDGVSTEAAALLEKAGTTGGLAGLLWHLLHSADTYIVMVIAGIFVDASDLIVQIGDRIEELLGPEAVEQFTNAVDALADSTTQG